MNWNIQNLSRIDCYMGWQKKIMFIIFQFLKFSLMISLHVAYQYTAHDKMHTILKIGNTKKEKNMKQSAVQKQPMGAFWFIFSTFFLKLIFYIRVISL